MMKQCLLASIALCISVQGAVEFDGTDDIMTISASSSLNNLQQNAFSASLWFKSDGINHSQYFVGKHAGGVNFGWLLWIYYNGYSRLQIWVYTDATSGLAASAQNPTYLSDNQWHHICIRYNNAGDKRPDIFIDATEISYDTHDAATGTLNNDSGGDLFIGGRTIDNNRNFDGCMTDITIWNTWLSDTDIKQIYDSGLKWYSLQMHPTNLVLYLPMDNYPAGTSGDGKVFSDMSKYRNNAMGSDGSGNTGLRCRAEEFLSYPE